MVQYGRYSTVWYGILPSADIILDAEILES